MREQGELEKKASSMHVSFKVTESKKEREDDDRELEPEETSVKKKANSVHIAFREL